MMIIRAAVSKIAHGGPAIGGAFGMVEAVIGAVDLNTVQVWCGAAVAIGAAVWGFIRDQKRRDFESEERKKWIQTMVDANIEAAERGMPLPFPQLDSIIMRPQ